MKAKVKVEKEIDITHIRIKVPVRYNQQDIPNDFPLRKGDVWEAVVNIDTGQILSWPEGKSGHLYMKVRDEGTYTLLNDNHGTLAKIAEIKEDYVPHGVVPGEFGDYIDLRIDPTGKITNWPKRPNVAAFFGGEEED